MHLPSLRYLFLHLNQLGLEGARALAARSWPSLALLNMSFNGLSEEAVFLFSGEVMPVLKRLILSGNRLP